MEYYANNATEHGRRDSDMRRKIATAKLVSVLISILLIAALAAGCVSIGRRDGVETGTTDDSSVDKAEEQDNGDMPAQEQPAGNGGAAAEDAGGAEEEIPALSDEEINGMYQKALEALGWFEFGTMPADYSDTREADGYEYYRVTHDTIKTYDALRSYLGTIFADAVIGRLLGGDGSGFRLFRDFDGALYTVPVGRGSDIFKGEETYEIIREGDRKVIYRVTVEVYDDPETQNVAGTEQYDFPLEYIDGKWVFTHFEPVR